MEKTIKKWNYAEHRYEDAENKYGVDIVFELGVKTKCVNCGIPITTDEKSRTSNQWQNEIGIGYSVCEYCFGLEQIAETQTK